MKKTNDTEKLGSGGQGSLMEKPHYSRNSVYCIQLSREVGLLHPAEQEDRVS